MIGDFTTAMRDPIFYRWHSFVDDVFQQFKGTLPRYTVDQVCDNLPRYIIGSLVCFQFLVGLSGN